MDKHLYFDARSNDQYRNSLSRDGSVFIVIKRRMYMLISVILRNSQLSGRVRRAIVASNFLPSETDDLHEVCDVWNVDDEF